MRARTLTVQQLVLAGCLVGLAAGGGAYAWLARGAGRREATPAPAAGPARLVFGDTVWPLDPKNPDAQLDFEWRRPGHHDFAFRSEGGPVRVRLNSTSCACTQVELGIGTDWHVLRPEDADGITMPPGAASVVRLSWKGEELGPKRLSAELRTEAAEAPPTTVTLEVPLNFVRPVRVAPEDSLKEPDSGEFWVGTLEPGTVRTLPLIVWSSTRDHFSLNLPAAENPHVRCGPAQSLGSDECARLCRRSDATVLCGYRVPVTVLERTADGQDLDLGAFAHRLQFTSEADPEPVTVDLAGSVRGPLTVGTDADRGEVSLGTFERGTGKSGELTLTTEEDALDVRVESVPDFLKVRLRGEKPPGPGRKAWLLTVTVPPDSLIGSIPPHTAVLLRTTGSAARRVCVPVTGYAYLK